MMCGDGMEWMREWTRVLEMYHTLVFECIAAEIPSRLPNSCVGCKTDIIT